MNNIYTLIMVCANELSYSRQLMSLKNGIKYKNERHPSSVWAHYFQSVDHYEEIPKLPIPFAGPKRKVLLFAKQILIKKFMACGQVSKPLNIGINVTTSSYGGKKPILHLRYVAFLVSFQLKEDCDLIFWSDP